MAMAEDCIAVEGIAGTVFLAVTGWMEMALDCMHAPVEGNAGTDCPTVACRETTQCIADRALMHPPF